jgi:hypothetical protein
MSPRNPLREDTYPQEVQKGENISNLRTQKCQRIIMPDGSIRTFITGENSSGVEQNGQVANIETTYVVFDSAGNAMPVDPQNLILSHTGCFIPTPEQRAICTSIFHSSPNRNIYIGQDGSLLGNGRAVCARCQSIRTTILIVLGILCIGIIWGIYKATGLLGLT